MRNAQLTPISDLIQEVLPANMQFKPTKEFYQSVGINKHRFSKILKGEIQPQRDELVALSNHFNICPSKLI